MTSKRILVPIDFSSHQDAVLAQAQVIGKAMDAELVLLHCAAPPELSAVAIEPVYVPPAVLERFTADHAAAVAQRMDALVESLEGKGRVSTVIRPTNPVEGILSVAREENCALIVMGSHGAGLDRFLLGSVAEAVTRNAECPVVIARSEEPSAFRKVVVGIDFSNYSLPLVELARQFAAADGEIHLVHSWQPPHLDSAHLFGDPGHEPLFATLNEGLRLHTEQLERFAGELAEDSRYRLHVETGRPAKVLLELYDSLGADAIVVGAHDSDRIENFLGTVSDRVLRHAGTTVLLTERARERGV